VKNLRLLVIILPMSLLLAAVISSLIDLESFLRLCQTINRWILNTFDNVFAYATLAFVVSCLWAFFSPLGRVKIGGADARPLLSRWNWFSITLCTTVAIGILFWATAEPMYHLYDPGGRDIAPGSEAAAEFALVSLFMHWSITPYAIYAIPGLCFALVYYNLGKPFSLAGPISVLVGRPLRPWQGDLLDAFALLTLISGIAASLGTGMLSLAGGVGNLINISTTPALLGLITVLIVSAFVVSSATGLQKGIRILSDINTRFFFAFAAFVFILGPSWELLSMSANGLWHYVQEFVPRSLILSDASSPQWAKDWTIFYWANWLAWAPLTALFLGRIARGYTVREYIAVNFFAPALFSIIWMGIFGGIALHTDLLEQGALHQVLLDHGPEAVLYELLQRFPFSGVLAVCLLLLSFVSYVTAADSNTEAIASVCLKSQAEPGAGKQTLYIKVMWAVLIGATAWVMTAFSGIDGIRMMSTLGGLPALFIVIAMNICLWLLGSRYLRKLS